MNWTRHREVKEANEILLFPFTNKIVDENGKSNVISEDYKRKKVVKEEAPTRSTIDIETTIIEVENFYGDKGPIYPLTFQTMKGHDKGGAMRERHLGDGDVT
ncbi:unnamed protein product [Sphenostylis stenocarpa]|uniref:Uncharacterized protein n=1 Tax=Sphenostylis stenocarpa TaxID=92480 RepID=A0AA86S9C6_9FABA|nr:unnamed protein product [Sphenostylis stenocarpa]